MEGHLDHDHDEARIDDHDCDHDHEDLDDEDGIVAGCHLDHDHDKDSIGVGTIRMIFMRLTNHEDGLDDHDDDDYHDIDLDNFDGIAGNSLPGQSEG